MRRVLLTPIVLILALLLAGCQHTNSISYPTKPVAVSVRIADLNHIVALANQNMVPVVVSLKDAGVITPDAAGKLALYQASVATTTKGVANVLAQPGPWPDKAIQIQNLALSLVPPAGYQKLGAADSVQYQALVLAIDSMESTLRIIVQMAKESPQK